MVFEGRKQWWGTEVAVALTVVNDLQLGANFKDNKGNFFFFFLRTEKPLCASESEGHDQN